MKKMMKFIACALVIAMAVCAFAACGAPAASSSAATTSKAAAATSAAATTAATTTASTSGAADGAAVKAIKEKGKIIMLTNAAFAPFEYLGSDNAPAGVDVDLAQKIADDLGVKLEVVNMDFDGLISALIAGKGDFIAAGMTVTDERKKTVDFTDPYVTSAQYIIVKKGDTSIKTWEDLKGKTVGVQKGTTGDLFASGEYDETIQPGCKSVERYPNAVDAAAALANGKLDCVIVDELPAKNIVATNTALELVDKSLTSEEYAFAVQKGSDLGAYLTSELNKMKSDGTVDKLVVQHTTEATVK